MKAHVQMQVNQSRAKPEKTPQTDAAKAVRPRVMTVRTAWPMRAKSIQAGSWTAGMIVGSGKCSQDKYVKGYRLVKGTVNRGQKSDRGET